MARQDIPQSKDRRDRHLDIAILAARGDLVEGKARVSARRTGNADARFLGG